MSCCAGVLNPMMTGAFSEVDPSCVACSLHSGLIDKYNKKTKCLFGQFLLINLELSKSSVMHCMQFFIALVKDQGIQKSRKISERNELVRQAPKPPKKRRCPNQFYSKLFLKSKVVLLKIESEKLVEKRRPLCAPRPPVSSSSMRWSNLRQEKQQQQRPRTICIRGHRPLCHSQP